MIWFQLTARKLTPRSIGNLTIFDEVGPFALAEFEMSHET